MRLPPIFMLFCQSNGTIFSIQIVELRRAYDVSDLEGIYRVFVSGSLSKCLVLVNNVRALVWLVVRPFFPLRLGLGGPDVIELLILIRWPLPAEAGRRPAET